MVGSLRFNSVPHRMKPTAPIWSLKGASPEAKGRSLGQQGLRKGAVAGAPESSFKNRRMESSGGWWVFLSPSALASPTARPAAEGERSEGKKDGGYAACIFSKARTKLRILERRQFGGVTRAL